MNTKEKSSSDPALARLPGLLPELERLYTDVHAHPELSMQAGDPDSRIGGGAAARRRLRRDRGGREDRRRWALAQRRRASSICEVDPTSRDQTHGILLGHLDDAVQADGEMPV
jgi:hypothetical protein